MMDEWLRPEAAHVLQVTDLTRRIKASLENGFTRLWVQGEVSNLRRQSSGHIYFSLKDAGSQLPCVLFARDATRQSFPIEAGMELLLLGDISVYEPHGRYQLVAKIALQAGLGRLQERFQQLKQQLQREGLFDAGRKQPLPLLPRSIAVVTSPTGAALRDFLRILDRRHFTGRVVVFPARVQGKGAAGEIETMLRQAASFSPAFDLVVLTRGGGSIEDLWAFNEESLARAVAECPRPVISAIGHEIDHVLTDYAADFRAETPSGAAERISSLQQEAKRSLQTVAQQLQAAAENHLQQANRRQTDARFRMKIIAPQRQLQLLLMRLDDAENRLRQAARESAAALQRKLDRRARALGVLHPRNRIALNAQGIESFRHRLHAIPHALLARKQEYCEQLKHRLENTSFQATLQRGYVLLKNPEGKLIDSLAALQPEPEIVAKFHDGETTLENPQTKRRES